MGQTRLRRRKHRWDSKLEMYWNCRYQGFCHWEETAQNYEFWTKSSIFWKFLLPMRKQRMQKIWRRAACGTDRLTGWLLLYDSHGGFGDSESLLVSWVARVAHPLVGPEVSILGAAGRWRSMSVLSYYWDGSSFVHVGGVLLGHTRAWPGRTGASAMPIPGRLARRPAIQRAIPECVRSFMETKIQRQETYLKQQTIFILWFQHQQPSKRYENSRTSNWLPTFSSEVIDSELLYLLGNEHTEKKLGNLGIRFRWLFGFAVGPPSLPRGHGKNFLILYHYNQRIEAFFQSHWHWSETWWDHGRECPWNKTKLRVSIIWFKIASRPVASGPSTSPRQILDNLANRPPSGNPWWQAICDRFKSITDRSWSLGLHRPIRRKTVTRLSKKACRFEFDLDCCWKYKYCLVPIKCAEKSWVFNASHKPFPPGAAPCFEMMHLSVVHHAQPHCNTARIYLQQIKRKISFKNVVTQPSNPATMSYSSWESSSIHIV